MTPVQSNVFRDALQVSPERIAALSDVELNELMRDLILAQAQRASADVSQVRVNTEGKAGDGGSDGWSPKPPQGDAWLGSAHTCWQFKAGVAGTPARLEGEVSKRIPRETLGAGGRFVVVCSKSTAGLPGEQLRLETLRSEAGALGLPTDSIDVIGSERLTIWCNQHPAVAARLAGRPAGLVRLTEWLQSDEHQAHWQGTQSAQDAIQRHRQDLIHPGGAATHIHICGHPGVGKTRFALELCRDAPWRSAVVYIQQATDFRLVELINAAIADTSVELVLVADEVQPEQLLPLRESIGRGQGRVRLVTIGHSPTPDPARIPAIVVKPLEPALMERVVRGLHPSLPPEHVDFVVRFADGFMRLARLASDAVERDRSIDVRGLLDLGHVRVFLDGMLGTGNRRPLHVVAVLTRVGWTEELAIEGATIARHLGLDWNDVRSSVEDFHRRLGIAPRGGRYRYVSPTPLAIYLAVEAWTTFTPELRSLAAALPTEDAKDAYYQRLQTIASNPQAQKFAREELAGFFQLADYADPRTAMRWSALAAADPQAAAGALYATLRQASIAERRSIADRARREVVWALVRLAQNSSAFRHATLSLALLAEAENETWGNNATGEFVARFLVTLGGTSVPYPKRLAVLDELLSSGEEGPSRLAISALAKVGVSQESRSVVGPATDAAPEPEWHPATPEDVAQCKAMAIRRLTELSRAGRTSLKAELVSAATGMSMLLRISELRQPVSEFYLGLAAAFPESREAVRRSVEHILTNERRLWKELPEAEVAAIAELHSHLEDPSLPSRLRQFVGTAHWDRQEDVDLSGLAAELLRDRTTLEAEWPWLTSGDAHDAWRLGAALASADADGVLDPVLPVLTRGGLDLRVLCGYASARVEQRGLSWLESWLSTRLSQDPADLPLLFEANWRVGATPHTTRLMVSALRAQALDERVVGQLGFGAWSGALPFDSLRELLEALADRGFPGVAVSLLEHRLDARPDEAALWEPLALRLIDDGTLVRDRHMAGHYWMELAKRFVSSHARRIAAAIFREQARRGDERWFVEHSPVKELLFECVESDPEGVWSELAPRLANPGDALMFSIGFADGLIDQMPRDTIRAWVAELPSQRVPLMARLTSLDLSSDTTLPALLIESYGEMEGVGEAFFGAQISGVWAGPTSEHWAAMGEALEAVARRTVLPGLRMWAERSAKSLREMAEREREREAEEQLGRG